MKNIFFDCTNVILLLQFSATLTYQISSLRLKTRVYPTIYSTQYTVYIKSNYSI